MTDSVTAFDGDRFLVSGSRDEVARFVRAHHTGREQAIRVHDDRTGRVLDLDYRACQGLAGAPAVRARGRPSLGVVAREVTLLPRHWDWLATQRGGASSAIRRLIDAAREEARTPRQRQDAAYAFMQSCCGDRPGFEEALRLLYRGDQAAFAAAIADWPQGSRDYIDRLLAE